MKIETEIPDQRIEDLLVSAFEGGVGYWAQIVGYVLPPGVLKPEVAPYAVLPLREGCAVLVRQTDEQKAPKLTLDRDAIAKGLTLMAQRYPRHFSDFMSETDDADTGDVFLQCCLLGEIVYQ